MKATFNYPPEFVTLPEYTAHAGQVVTVLQKLTDAEHDEAYGEGMFKIQADDGWTGDAFESELDPLPEL